MAEGGQPSAMGSGEEFKFEAERFARDVPGVASVRDELIVVRSAIGP